jgi:ADP-ribosylglycohydrolase
VEFKSAAVIQRLYPSGVRLLQDGGVWDTLAGQPTDDSELALALARTLALVGGYDTEAVATSYARWYSSGPFDIGDTTRVALSAAADAAAKGECVAAAAEKAASRSSQANGALMRISPLGILGSVLTANEVSAWARKDACLTHPNPICQDCNVVYTASIAFAIRRGASAYEIYQDALSVARKEGVDPAVLLRLTEAASNLPADYERQQGWVLTAFQNAYYQLLHAPNLEEGVVATVHKGGDTDTNGAIAGALLGAAWGVESVPRQWMECLTNCRPQEGNTGVKTPRPSEYWPIDVLELAGRLVA